MAIPASASGQGKAAANLSDVVDSITGIETTLIAAFTEQAVVFAASITPDPTKGDIIIVGQLTGNITVANPAAGAQYVGRELTFYFQQDGTGSRSITWGNKFIVPAAAVSGTASKFSNVKVQWNGTNWVHVGGSAAYA